MTKQPLEAYPFNRSINLGFAAIAFAAFLWATAAIAASHLFQAGVTPTELTMLRSVIATIGLGVMSYGRKIGEWRWDWQIFGLGLSLAFVTVTYYVAISRLPVAVAIVIQYTAPALIVFLNALRYRRLPARATGLAAIVALLGVMLVSELGTLHLQLDPFGFAAAILSALFFASYTLLSEAVVNRYGAIGVMLRGFAISSVFWLIVQFSQGFSPTLLQFHNLPGILFVGIGGTLIPFSLLCWGIQQVKAERGAIGATLEPVLAAILAWLVLGQALSLKQILGSLLVLGAITSLQIQRSRPALTPDP